MHTCLHVQIRERWKDESKNVNLFCYLAHSDRPLLVCLLITTMLGTTVYLPFKTNGINHHTLSLFLFVCLPLAYNVSGGKVDEMK